MNQQDPAVSNPRPNIPEDDIQKVEAARRAAECSRAVAEASRASAESRREQAEQERNADENSRQVAEVDRRAAEEHRRSSEELRQAAKETRVAAKDLRAAAEEAKSVLEGAKQTQKNGEDGIGGGMSIQLFQVEQMRGYLAARFIGSGAAEDIWQEFEFIAEHCKRTKNNKLLMDVTRYEGKISLIEKYSAAEESRIFSRYGIKVAFVDIPERVDPEKFAEMVARNRGVNVRLFSDFQAAEEWLLK